MVLWYPRPFLDLKKPKTQTRDSVTWCDHVGGAMLLSVLCELALRLKSMQRFLLHTPEAGNNPESRSFGPRRRSRLGQRRWRVRCLLQRNVVKIQRDEDSSRVRAQSCCCSPVSLKHEKYVMLSTPGESVLTLMWPSWDSDVVRRIVCP